MQDLASGAQANPPTPQERAQSSLPENLEPNPQLVGNPQPPVPSVDALSTPHKEGLYSPLVPPSTPAPFEAAKVESPAAPTVVQEPVQIQPLPTSSDLRNRPTLETPPMEVTATPTQVSEVPTGPPPIPSAPAPVTPVEQPLSQEPIPNIPAIPTVPTPTPQEATISAAPAAVSTETTPLPISEPQVTPSKIDFSPEVQAQVDALASKQNKIGNVLPETSEKTDEEVSIETGKPAKDENATAEQLEATIGLDLK